MTKTFDGFINKILSENKVDDELAEQILQSFKTKYRSNSKTKDLLEKFKSEGRVLNKPKTTKTISKFNKSDILPNEWLNPKKWKGIDDAGIPIKHVPPVVDDVVDDVVSNVADEARIQDELFPPSNGGNGDEIIEETATEIISPRNNPFNLESKGGFATVELNFKFFDAFNQLKYISTKASPKIRETLEKITKSIREGQKLTWADAEMTTLRTSGLGPDDVDLIIERLKYPVKTKMGILGEIYWKWIEPFVRKYRESMLNFDYFRNLANRYGAKLPDKTASGYFDNFLKTLELRLTKMNVTTGISEGEIKQLKDKFLRLRSELGESDQYYTQLWEDLNAYMLKNLDTKSLKSWGDLTKKLMSENPSGWRFSSWKEIINDGTFTKMADDAVIKKAPKESQDIFQNIMETSLLKSSEELTKGVLNWVKRNGARLWSWLWTGAWRTPKDMMTYMISKGYATKAKGPFGITMTAGGANYIQTQLYKFIYVPLIYGVATTLFEAGMETYSGLNIDGKPFFDGLFSILYKSLISKNIIGDFNDIIHHSTESDSFKSQYPDWYKFIEPLYDVSFSSVSNKAFKRVIESQFIIDQLTPQEKAHDDLDELVTTTNTKLAANQTIKDEFEARKQFINGYMVERGLILNETATNVTKNMYIKLGVDPEITKRGHEAIDNVYKQVGILDKLKSTKDNAIEIKSELEKAPIVSYMVKSNGGDFKVVNSGGEGGFVYEDKDGSQHPLNELKF